MATNFTEENTGALLRLTRPNTWCLLSGVPGEGNKGSMSLGLASGEKKCVFWSEAGQAVSCQTLGCSSCF